MMQNPVAILLAAAIMSVAGVSAARSAPRFVETPKMVDDITRGDEDGLRCSLGYLGPTQISNCAFAMARVNAKDGSDTRAYNVGLTFETWRDLDADWVADQKPAKPSEVTAAQLHDEEAATRAMYLLYRGARDALGISDKELLSLMTKMTVQGRATTWDRLQFWAKQPH
jgi:hypothetical protein